MPKPSVAPTPSRTVRDTGNFRFGTRSGPLLIKPVLSGCRVSMGVPHHVAQILLPFPQPTINQMSASPKPSKCTPHAVRMRYRDQLRPFNRNNRNNRNPVLQMSLNFNRLIFHTIWSARHNPKSGIYFSKQPQEQRTLSTRASHRSKLILRRHARLLFIMDNPNGKEQPTEKQYSY